MLRVVGGPGDPATRIGDRIGEPAVNPCAYIVSQVHAGPDGLARRLAPALPTVTPYAGGGERLPTTLGEALDALEADAGLVDTMGRPFVEVFVRAKRQEQARFDAAEHKSLLDRRE